MALSAKQLFGRSISTGLVYIALAYPTFAAGDDKQHPVNCATAPGDLRAIAAEKKHAEEQQAESVVSILPAGALLGLITGTENKHLKMLSGDYVEQLDARAAEIKSTCGIN